MSRSTAINSLEAILSGETPLSIPIRSAHHDNASTRSATPTRQRQNNIKHPNFEHIKFTYWDLPELNGIARDKRAQIERISLSLQLEGDAQRVLSEFPYSLRETEDCMVITAMRDLFWILRSWEPQGKLHLEIELYSASQESLDSTKPARPPADTEIPGCDGLFLNEAYEEYWWQTLPEIAAVTSLLLKVRHDRSWKPSMLHNMVSRLPNLEEIRYEHMPQDPAVKAMPLYDQPLFSDERWTSALEYYYKMVELYFTVPDSTHYMRTEFDPLRPPTADDEVPEPPSHLIY